MCALALFHSSEGKMDDPTVFLAAYGVVAYLLLRLKYTKSARSLCSASSSPSHGSHHNTTWLFGYARPFPHSQAMRVWWPQSSQCVETCSCCLPVFICCLLAPGGVDSGPPPQPLSSHHCSGTCSRHCCCTAGLAEPRGYRCPHSPTSPLPGY